MVPVLLLLLFLLAVAYSREWIPEGREEVTSLLCLLLTAGVGAWRAARRAGRARMLHGLAGVAGLAATVLLVALLARPEASQTSAVLVALLVLLGGCLLGVCCASGRNRRRKR
jgi:putative membrane protein (TIGR04086 family)